MQVTTLVIRLCIAVSLAITPWTTFDPINPPKFLLLSIIGGVCLFQLIMQGGYLRLSNKLKILLTLMIILPSISALMTRANFGRDLYGTYGRLFGVITVCSLVLVTSYFANIEDFDSKRFLNSFQIMSVITISYGVLQFLGKDFAPWENPYSPIVGFLGNPNFMSSFLGISVIILSYWYVEFRKNLYKTATALIFQILGIILIIKSDSIQGIYVILIGVFSSFCYYIIQKRRILFNLTLLMIMLCSFFLIGMALFQKGPLSSYFLTGTLANRVEYWKTGVKIFLGNWKFGVGPDQFGTWFRQYRPESTVKILGTEVITDSPHNSIIEFAANYGIVGLVAYLLLIGTVIISIIKYALKSKKISIEHMIISGAFLGYFAQSLISPNQIGVAIWGWAFMGVISNKNFSTIHNNYDYRSEKKTDARSAQTAKHLESSKDLLNVLIGSLIGLIIAIPLFYQHMLYRNALETSDAVRIIKVAESWPQQEYIQIQIIEILMQNQYWALSKRLNSQLLSYFPDSYLGWQKYFENKETTADEKEKARNELHRLDPLNPSWS